MLSCKEGELIFLQNAELFCYIIYYFALCSLRFIEIIVSKPCLEAMLIISRN